MKRISESEQFTGYLPSATAAQCNGGEAPQLTVEPLLPPPAAINWKRSAIAMFQHWWQRRKTVKILRALNSDQLKDIGLSRNDIDKL
ncbi:MAG: DUF1127 domain-containing protein [Rouxiella aceris]|nr:DUF1127 domain-containing protein [Rouxiella aceris]MDR3432643.1 DUF1127 domain-containing protein [Rouxiella aceris]